MSLTPGKPWYIINPQSNAFATWQLITTIALAFVVTVVPYQVGLLELDWDFLLIASSLVDLVFLIDMILNFFTMPLSGVDSEFVCVLGNSCSCMVFCRCADLSLEPGTWQVSADNSAWHQVGRQPRKNRTAVHLWLVLH